MEELEMIYFEMISGVGTARSMFIEAIQHAKAGNFDTAKASIEEGNNFFIEGHKAHAKLIQKEASGEPLAFSLLLVHAEDQFMSAETFKIISEEFIDLYERLETGK